MFKGTPTGIHELNFLEVRYQPTRENLEIASMADFFVYLEFCQISVSDPDSLIPDPDPAFFRLNTDPDQGFDDQKLKKFVAEYKFFKIFFD
jgi:hypothetical protein